MPESKMNYEIIGADSQLLQVTLFPEETIVAEKGAMLWMDSDINFKVILGDGSKDSSGLWSKVADVSKRLLTGEKLVLTHFKNLNLEKTKTVGLTGSHPGKVIPVDLEQHNNKLICQSSSFLAAQSGIRINVELVKKFGTGIFSKNGFILQALQGKGLAFIHASGTVVKRELRNETIYVDIGALVAFSSGIDFGIKRAGGPMTMMFGGEGLFLIQLRGTGTVYLQNFSFPTLAEEIMKVSGVEEQMAEMQKKSKLVARKNRTIKS